MDRLAVFKHLRKHHIKVKVNWFVATEGRARDHGSMFPTPPRGGQQVQSELLTIGAGAAVRIRKSSLLGKCFSEAGEAEPQPTGLD